MDKKELLKNWIDSKKKLAIQNGEPLFQGIPDSWFDSAEWCCENGHIYGAYLKSEQFGCLCFECSKQVFLFPKNATILEFNEVIGKGGLDGDNT